MALVETTALVEFGLVALERRLACAVGVIVELIVAGAVVGPARNSVAALLAREGRAVAEDAELLEGSEDS